MKKIIIYLLIIASLSSCNTWVGKQYVNTVARYNRIYNSQKKIAATDKTIKKSFKDDFNKTLPLFNLGSESSLKGNGGEMDKVLKKTSRVIEKYPKSKWNDDAWFLMGQSYFYRGDFFAAIETFEFVSTKYKKTDIGYRANLWTLYCYILMNKESESLAIISKLKNEKSFPSTYKKGLFISAAEIAIRQGKPSLAIENLNAAIPLLKNKDEKIRYNYVLAQIYQASDSFEKASYHYNKVIKYNPPYDFNFNSQINMASSLVMGENQSYKKAQSLLNRMLKDDKNIDYYSKIYFELGRIDELSNKTKSALRNYKKALYENGNNSIIKTNAYNAIGSIYFAQNNYLTADKYFDSANQTLDQSHPRFEELSKLRENQSDLLNDLVKLQTNDSLLMMAENPDKLEKEIDRQIAAERKRLKDLEAQKEKNQNSNNNNPGFNNNNPFNNQPNGNTPIVSTANASFPFYDATLRARGNNDFKAKWGDRKLTDNWRVSSIASGAETNTEDPKAQDSAKTKDPIIAENSGAPENIEEERKKYYANIPYSKTQKSKLHSENKQSLFNLGIMHLYNLEQPQKGVSYLLSLQKRYPKHSNEPQTLYELAKHNKSIGNSDNYNSYFNKLASAYPKSKYLMVLKNELIADNESAKNNVSKEAQNLYNQAYESYQLGNYSQVLNIKKEYMKKYAGNALQSNFEYLEALTFARTNRLNEYEKKLVEIIANYPNTIVSENAARNLIFLKSKTQTDTTKTSVSKKDELFSKDPMANYYAMLVLPIKVNTNNLKNALNDFHQSDYSLVNLEITEIIVGNKKCILIKGFEKLKSNQDYLNVLKQKEVLTKKDKDAKKLVISEDNLKKLLANQQIDAYLKFANIAYKK